MKHFLNYQTSTEEIESTLTWTQYYTVNPEDEDKIVFPSDINLANVLSDVYRNDVVITFKEMRDYLFIAQITKNDADSNAALIIKGDVETYMWDKDEATFYTKEEFALNEASIQVYKTTESSKRYGNLYYYAWKDISNITPDVVGNGDGSISFVFDVEETSGMRAHQVEFIVLDNKLIGFEKYYYNQNVLTYIETTIFSYEDIEVDVPSLLQEGEANAVVE